MFWTKENNTYPLKDTCCDLDPVPYRLNVNGEEFGELVAALDSGRWVLSDQPFAKEKIADVDELLSMAGRRMKNTLQRPLVIGGALKDHEAYEIFVDIMGERKVGEDFIDSVRRALGGLTGEMIEQPSVVDIQQAEVFLGACVEYLDNDTSWFLE